MTSLSVDAREISAVSPISSETSWTSSTPSTTGKNEVYSKVSSIYCVLNDCNREQLKRNYNLARFRLQVNLQDVSAFDEQLGERLNRQPTEYLPLVRIEFGPINFELYILS